MKGSLKRERKKLLRVNSKEYITTTAARIEIKESEDSERKLLLYSEEKGMVSSSVGVVKPSKLVDLSKLRVKTEKTLEMSKELVKVESRKELLSDSLGEESYYEKKNVLRVIVWYVDVLKVLPLSWDVLGKLVNRLVWLWDKKVSVGLEKKELESSSSSSEEKVRLNTLLIKVLGYVKKKVRGWKKELRGRIDWNRMGLIYIPYALGIGMLSTLMKERLSEVRCEVNVKLVEVSWSSEKTSNSSSSWSEKKKENVNRLLKESLEKVGYESLRIGHYSSKVFVLWSFIKIWKGIRPSSAYVGEYSIVTRKIRSSENKKRLSDVSGIEKYIPVLKSVVESLSEVKRKWLWLLKRERLVSSSSGPKGYLLVGKPGTGKTLLGQALAGEACVSLICLSASEIEKQLDIGTRIGALRVRNLFNSARNSTPCILLIDEIDSIGGSRVEKSETSSSSSSSDTSVLTEFLVQMDNYSLEDGLVVVGTTNYLSSLDGALIRSGRFDRIIGLELPSIKTRERLLEMYMLKSRLGLPKELELGSSWYGDSWKKLLKETKGLSAADLSIVVNESSLKALGERELKEGVKRSHTLESLEKGINSIKDRSKK